MKSNATLLEEYNDHLAPLYDAATTETDSSWTAPKEVSDFVFPFVTSGAEVLDIGIGTGQSAEPLDSAGARITGIDTSDRMLEIAKQKHPSWNLLKADINNSFPEINDSFDVVMACGVLEFIEDIEVLFSNARSVLKDGGYFCFTYEEYLPEHPLQKDRVSELGKGLKDPVPEAASFLVYRRSEKEIKDALTASGFTQIKSKQFTSYYKAEGRYPVIYEVVLAQAT